MVGLLILVVKQSKLTKFHVIQKFASIYCQLFSGNDNGRITNTGSEIVEIDKIPCNPKICINILQDFREQESTYIGKKMVEISEILCNKKIASIHCWISDCHYWPKMVEISEIPCNSKICINILLAFLWKLAHSDSYYWPDNGQKRLIFM